MGIFKESIKESHNSTEYKNLIKKNLKTQKLKRAMKKYPLKNHSEWSMNEGERTENWARIIKEVEFWRL